MQIYLHHYIWYIFSSVTIPIINFRGIVHTENEHSFIVYSIRTRVRKHMFVWIFWQFRIFNRVYNILYTNICSSSHSHTQSSRRTPCQIAGAAKKLRLGSCKGAATAFSRAARELRFISASEKLRFRLFLWACEQNLTKNFKFFQKAAIKLKNLKKF